MTIDDQYPFLSLLALQYGSCGLEILGQRAQPRELVYFGLGDCCNEILNEVKRTPAPRCDSYNYLATLDAFVKTIAGDCRKQETLWNKIKDNKVFLNTVVEAAWAVHFWNLGLSPLIDEPLDPSDPKGKNVDVAVVLDGMTYWLDALNVDLRNSPFFVAPNRSRPSLPPVNHGCLLDELVTRAREKYKDKFKTALSSGIGGCSLVGVLLCVMKSEPYVMPYLRSVKPIPPPRLFGADTQGLGIVVIHTLRDDQSSDILKPYKLLVWARHVGGSIPDIP